jgi:hypothetical protein
LVPVPVSVPVLMVRVFFGGSGAGAWCRLRNSLVPVPVRGADKKNSVSILGAD